MGSSAYEKHYLFRDSEDCCNRFFPTVSDCPYEDHTTATQTGYYWETYHDDISNLEDMPVQYNHTYYPDINANTCVNGTDYPSWMASDVDYKRLYLFKTIKGCCNHWFQAYVDGCEKAVIQGVYEFMEPCPTNRVSRELSLLLLVHLDDINFTHRFPFYSLIAIIIQQLQLMSLRITWENGIQIPGHIHAGTMERHPVGCYGDHMLNGTSSIQESNVVQHLDFAE